MWSVETLDERVDAEIRALPPSLQARYLRVVELIVDIGLDAVPRGWTKSFGGGLWEVRFSGAEGIARAFYVTRAGQRLIVLRVFVKKTPKTPEREIEKARQRAKEAI